MATYVFLINDRHTARLFTAKRRAAGWLWTSGGPRQEDSLEPQTEQGRGACRAADASSSWRAASAAPHHHPLCRGRWQVQARGTGDNQLCPPALELPASEWRGTDLDGTLGTAPAPGTHPGTHWLTAGARPSKFPSPSPPRRGPPPQPSGQAGGEPAVARARPPARNPPQRIAGRCLTNNLEGA
ncbi:hypothetical protein Purlil1_100 [Purpureocillium lilacinum]|uniref:Uncharacterized protein n=1 Tax=Purpureocillium lilacinum TaxID=33203 RepID=A0ABR0CGM3_PURLI|nr:hypothetical protein Purlil1_100 [Purpureocillium lilacinum]